MIGSYPELSTGDTRSARRRELERLLGEYRVSEFTCTVVMFGLALFFAYIPVQRRPIPSVEVQINSTATLWARDPMLNAKVHREQVTTEVLVFVGVTGPVVVNLLMNYVLKARVVPHDTRDFLLALAQSASMSELLTKFTKNLTGRFRPSFHDMCGWQYHVVWDGASNLCTNLVGEKEGRKSFPSGHASFAWSTMLVLTVRIACPEHYFRLSLTSHSNLLFGGSSTCWDGRASIAKIAMSQQCEADEKCSSSCCASRRPSWRRGWRSRAPSTTGTTTPTFWPAASSAPCPLAWRTATTTARSSAGNQPAFPAKNAIATLDGDATLTSDRCDTKARDISST